MKARFAAPLILLLAGLAIVFCQDAVTEKAAANTTTSALRAVALSLPSLQDEPTAAYVGSNKCKMCHVKQYKSWKKSRKFKSLATLKPGNAAEVKKAHGLDPDKDYSTDPTCLACHTTGFGHEGGYAIPDPTDEKAVRKARKLAVVGCESCHGPGGAYLELHKELLMSKRKYKSEEMYAAGMLKIEESNCTRCHNAENPTANPDSPFDFAAKKEIGAHDHFPLKQRED